MKIIIMKSLVLLFYVFMVYMNYLANALPLNNRSTGAISDSYPSLFTPSGFTFAIWGVIYLMLFAFVVKILMEPAQSFDQEYMMRIVYLFVASSVLNILWLLCWHYDYIVLSSLIMLVFVVVNLYSVHVLPNSEVLYKSAFSIYAGWILVAFIANISITIVKLDIGFFLRNENLWYLLITFAGFAVVSGILIIDRNIVIGLVFSWAYFGILMKHISQTGKYLESTQLTFYTGVLVALILANTIYTFILNDLKLFSH